MNKFALVLMSSTAGIVVPMIVILLAAGVIASILVLSDTLQKSRGKAIEPPTCSCGYNLTGNQSGVCPECGMKIAKELQ